MKPRVIAILTALLAATALLGIACADGSTGASPATGPDAAPALQAGGDGQPQGISVSGRGSVTAEPDTALLSLGVSVFADTARDARDQAAQAMNDLLDSLKGNGVDPDDIKTTQFSLSPEFDYSRAGSPRVIGYRLTNMVSVKVRDLDRVPEVIDEGVDAVGDPIQISGLTFTLDDPASLLAQARAAAMTEAQAKAQQLADLAGVSLGKPIAISESSGGGLPPIFGARELPAADEATPIEPGQLEIAVSVAVTYAIQ